MAEKPTSADLIKAVKTRDLKRVKELLAAGADPSAREEHLSTLDLANHGKGGDEDEMMAMLLEAGADPAKSRGCTLPWSLIQGHRKTALALVKAGASLTSGMLASPLQIACLTGFDEVVDAMIAAGVDLNYGTKFNEVIVKTPLLAAIDAGKTTVACKLILAGADVNLGISQKQFPITEAAAKGNLEVVRSLLRFGANPEIKDGTGMTAFGWALKNNHADVLALLNEAGIEGQRDSLDEQMLTAAEEGDAAAIARHVKAGANVNARDTRDATKGRTPLMLAARKGHLDAVKVLIEFGADVNASDDPKKEHEAQAKFWREGGLEYAEKNPLNRTALLFAARFGRANVVKALLDAGAFPAAKDHLGYTARMLAEKFEHNTVNDLFSGSTEDIDAVNADGETALMIAAKNGDVERVRKLLASGALVLAKNKKGRTALSTAAENCNLEVLNELLTVLKAQNPKLSKPLAKTICLAMIPALMARRKVPLNTRSKAEGEAYEHVPVSDAEIAPFINALLKAGANPNAQESFWDSPLMVASSNGHVECGLCLIRGGADINLRHHNSDTTPLINAVKRHQFRFAAMLVENGAGPNLQTDSGTALHEAVRIKNADVIAVLLKHGAEVNALDINGMTPLALAKEKRLPSLAGILAEHGGVEKVAPSAEHAERIRKFTENVEAKKQNGKREHDKLWGPETPIPDFSAASKSSAYKAALDELAKKCSAKLKAEGELPGLFILQDVDGNVDIEALQKNPCRNQCFVFAPKSLDTRTLAVLPTSDRYQAIAAMQTNGANYGIGPGGIIQWLKELEKE